MKPFLKWAGGKKQLLPKILSVLPEQIGTYHEPFLGGGAVFFALARENRIQRAFLNDVNRRLMITYQQVARNPLGVMRRLGEYKDTREDYILARQRLNAIGEHAYDYAEEVAALMIYLNKTCFNGLYRESRAGHMNSPYGRSSSSAPRTIVDTLGLEGASFALDNRVANFSALDFQAAVSTVQAGDVVYFDPPYAPVHKTSFIGYNGAKFDEPVQVELAETFKRLSERGAKLLLSNSDVPMIHSLYAGFEIERIEARRSINSKGTGRGKVGEVLVRNF